MPHPNLQRSLLVFFPFAANAYTFKRQVVRLSSCQKFLRKFEHIYLARIPQQLAAAVLNERGELSSGHWILRKVPEEKLDWAYPSYDISLERLANPIGQDLAVYRKKTRKFNASEVSTVLVANIASEADKRTVIASAIGHVSRRWIWTKSKSLAAHPDRGAILEEMIDPYRGLAKLSSVKDLEIDGLVLKRGNENLAFSFWEKPRTKDEPVVCMAALPCSHEIGLSEYLYHQIATTLHSQGYKTMCIGGSETAELDRFKRKLAPIQPYHHLHTLELVLGKAPVTERAEADS
jgi:hypothetical protein